MLENCLLELNLMVADYLARHYMLHYQRACEEALEVGEFSLDDVYEKFSVRDIVDYCDDNYGLSEMLNEMSDRDIISYITSNCGMDEVLEDYDLSDIREWIADNYDISDVVCWRSY